MWENTISIVKSRIIRYYEKGKGQAEALAAEAV